MIQDIHEEFVEVERGWGKYWKHKFNEFFIVFYEILEEKKQPPFIAYRATNGSYQRDPWTVSNRKVGEFKTLEEAMKYVKKV